MTTLDPDWIADLRCPETRSTLRAIEAAELEALNARIRAGDVRNVGGEQVEEALEDALVREQGDLAYPVRGGIPRLIVEEGMPLSGGVSEQEHSGAS
jgi:uncharacterized protein YbaR (Trm112 family)